MSRIAISGLIPDFPLTMLLRACRVTPRTLAPVRNGTGPAVQGNHAERCDRDGRVFHGHGGFLLARHGHGPYIQVAFERLQTELGTTLYIGFNSTTAQLAYFRSLRFPLVCPSRRSIQVPLPVWPRPFRAPSSTEFRVIPGSQPPQLVSSAAAQSTFRTARERPPSVEPSTYRACFWPEESPSLPGCSDRIMPVRRASS